MKIFSENLNRNLWLHSYIYRRSSQKPRGDEMLEHEITAGLKKRDAKAFEEVIKRFTPLVASIVRNVSRGSLSKEDMEETVADVFVTLWKNTDNIVDSKLKGYICCIAKTKALTKITSVNRHILLDIDDYDAEDDFSVSSEVEKQEIVNSLREIISETEMPEKEIVIRYYYYYQSITQIAEIMKMNPETVKTKLRRTRDKIKRRLSERGYTL